MQVHEVEPGACHYIQESSNRSDNTPNLEQSFPHDFLSTFTRVHNNYLELLEKMKLNTDRGNQQNES